MSDKGDPPFFLCLVAFLFVCWLCSECCDSFDCAVAVRRVRGVGVVRVGVVGAGIELVRYRAHNPQEGV